jgi:hypothetical protein
MTGWCHKLFLFILRSNNTRHGWLSNRFIHFVLAGHEKERVICGSIFAVARSE